MKQKCLVAAGLGLAQLALLNTVVYAQDTTRVLNDVVVTATRSPIKLSDIGRDVEVITIQQIIRSLGKTLPELLNGIPDITFSGANNAPGISSSVYLRGAAAGNILVLVDGFPVNNASSIDNSYDLNAFPIDQIERIEILKGSGSTLYGSDAVGGVINIITKRYFEKKFNNEIQLSSGSYNTFQESYGLNKDFKHTDVTINLSNTDSRGFPAATDTTGKAGFKYDGFHQRSINLKINQWVSGRFTLLGNLQTTYNTGNLPYGSFSDDKNYTYANTFLFGGIGGKLQLNKGALTVNISQNDVWNKYTDLAGVTNFETYSYEKNTGRITNAEVILNYNLDKFFDLTSGADFKYSNTNQLGTYDTISSRAAHNSIASIYTSLFYKSKIFHMELGGRYNRDSRYGNNFTYTVNPSVFLAGQFKLFAIMASAFKSPSLYQLVSQYGNENLKPETTTSYEAGFNWELIKNILSFKTSLFKYHTNNVIYFLEEAYRPYGVYRNGQIQKNKGFESELKLTMDKVTATAYAAYVTGVLTDENGMVSNNLYRVPKSTYGASIYYQLTKIFSAGLSDKYNGNRTDEDFNTTPVSLITLKHYNLLDAHLQYDINKRIILFADLKNLFNIKYTDWYGYSTRRFNFMAGVRYQIN